MIDVMVRQSYGLESEGVARSARGHRTCSSVSAVLMAVTNCGSSLILSTCPHGRGQAAHAHLKRDTQNTRPALPSPIPAPARLGTRGRPAPASQRQVRAGCAKGHPPKTSPWALVSLRLPRNTPPASLSSSEIFLVFGTVKLVHCSKKDTQ